MIQRNEETGKYRAFCDCCSETSDEYEIFSGCRRGLKDNGWKTRYNEEESMMEHFCPECRED